MKGFIFNNFFYHFEFTMHLVLRVNLASSTNLYIIFNIIS